MALATTSAPATSRRTRRTRDAFRRPAGGFFFFVCVLSWLFFCLCLTVSPCMVSLGSGFDDTYGTDSFLWFGVPRVCFAAVVVQGGVYTITDAFVSLCLVSVASHKA